MKNSKINIKTDSGINSDKFLSYLKELPNYMTIFVATILPAAASPILIEMSNTVGYSTGDLGLIFTFFTIGIVTGQLTSVFYNRKFKKIIIILSGYTLMISCLILMANIKNLYLFYVLYFLAGYTAGVLWIQATKYILENRIKNKDRLTSILLIFNSLGYISAPLISSNLIKNGISWSYSYYLLAGLALIVLVLYVIFKFDRREKVLLQDEEKISFTRTFNNRMLNVVFALGCLIVFFYCISEAVIVVWTPTFLRSEKLFDIQTASLAASIFWLAVLGGRIIVSFIAGKFRANLIILTLSIIAVIAMPIFIVLKSVRSILTAISFAGLGCSAIVPLAISSTSTIYKKGRGLLASLLFAIASLGTSVTPLITRSLLKLNMTLPMIVAVAPLFMGATFLIVLGKSVYEQKSK